MADLLSAQYKSFRADIRKNELFLAIESRIKNPASARSRPRSEALLSAYVTLTCGRFEDYLKTIFGEAAVSLALRVPLATDLRLGESFYWNNLHGFIAWSMKSRRIDRADMISYIEQFSSSVASRKIHPRSFQDTVANPNAATLKSMFNQFGVSDPFAKLSAIYNDSLNRTLAKRIIEQNLNRFIRRRNEAAHQGRISGATRVDIMDDHIFMVGLAQAVKGVLANHVATV